jgi:hypothetical protein
LIDVAVTPGALALFVPLEPVVPPVAPADPDVPPEELVGGVELLDELLQAANTAAATMTTMPLVKRCLI